MNVVLIGAPGSGKGTQADRLVARYGLEHLSAGDILRAEIAAQSETGLAISETVARGELVPDELVVGMMIPVALAAAERGGYLLDGFPRSIAQAIEARRLAQEAGSVADAVIYLDAPTEKLVDRLLDRAAKEGRSDDNLETIRQRMRVFEAETMPLIEYYQGRGLLRRIDATLDPDQVADAISVELEKLLPKTSGSGATE